MRLTFARATAVGLFLCLTACHKKAAVTPPPPTPPAPAPVVLTLDEADRAFGANGYPRAALRYEEYLFLSPSGDQRDRALFQLGVIHSVPGYLEYDPQRTALFLKRVINEYPASPLKPVAELILGLQDELGQLAANRDQANQRVQQLTAEVERLKQAPARLAIEEASRALASNSCANAVPSLEEYLRLSPSGDEREMALFELGICYGSADYNRRNWDRATANFKQLAAQSPASPFTQMAQMILTLRDEIAKFSLDSEQNNQTIRRLNAELDRLKEIDRQRPRRP